MEFSKRLDALMSLTKVTNSSLARYCSLDASFISRLRRGKRNVVPDAPYLRNMSKYLSKNIKTEIQKETLISLINKPLDFLDFKKVNQEVLSWLIGKKKTSIVAAIKGYEKGNFSFVSNDNYIQDDIINVSSFIAFGDQGKREVVIKFLKEVISSSKKTTLYLYSDENMDWLTEDRMYLNIWSTLLVKVIQKGNKIVIIHTIERAFDEIINAIMQWVPMYLTGAIEPYYYPKRRDGLLKRTLFIAKDIAVVNANSINKNKTANLFFTEEDIIRSFEEEFLNLLKQCKPLMRIYKNGEFDEFRNIFNEFESEDNLTYLKSMNFSSLTIPKRLINKLRKKGEISKKDEIFLLNRKNKFESNLAKIQYFEVMTMPDICNGLVLSSDIIKVDGKLLKLKYNLDDLIVHLNHIVDLMEKYRNFNVSINKQDKTPFILYVKEGIGLIVIKAEEPIIAFAVNESNLTAAFIDYFHKNYLNLYNKKRSIKNIKCVLKDLEKLNNN